MTSTVISAGPVSSESELDQRQSWLQVVTHLDPKYGGMSAAVPALSSAIQASGNHRVSLAGFCAQDEAFTHNDLPVHGLPLGYSTWLRDGDARYRFRNLVNHAVGIHIHGLWEQSTLVAAHAARKAGKPYLISAHGMLQPWALNNKRVKKVLYGALIEKSNLKHAGCLHALTVAEAHDYRNYGLTNPIAVIPNGVDIPLHADRELFLDQFPALRGKRLILFLSRIHFKKGLDILSQAWASASKRWPDAHLVLAGPDFENTRASIESFVNSSGLTDRVSFTGMLDQNLKWSALSAAEVFVLPSYSEGLSVSVLEAMGMGLPVIVTSQCNLPEVDQNACGWVIEPDVAELEAALDNCLSVSELSLQAMGSRGRRLVQKNYSWQMVGQQMSAVYSWLQGGSVPDGGIMHFGDGQ